MKHLSIQQLENLGFEPVKNYIHDQFMTSRRAKGVIEVETTWRLDGKFESQDFCIQEINMQKFTKKEIKQLDKILNKNN